MRSLTAILVIPIALTLGACTQRQSDATARKAGRDAHTAAREAGKAAYKIAEKTKEAAKKAGHELRVAGEQAHEGWKEAQREQQQTKK